MINIQWTKFEQNLLSLLFGRNYLQGVPAKPVQEKHSPLALPRIQSDMSEILPNSAQESLSKNMHVPLEKAFGLKGPSGRNKAILREHGSSKLERENLKAPGEKTA